MSLSCPVNALLLVLAGSHIATIESRPFNTLNKLAQFFYRLRVNIPLLCNGGQQVLPSLEIDHDDLRFVARVRRSGAEKRTLPSCGTSLIPLNGGSKEIGMVSGGNFFSSSISSVTVLIIMARLLCGLAASLCASRFSKLSAGSL